MKNFLPYKLLRKKTSVGLLCNQSGWHRETGRYSFESLAEAGVLRRVFVPEHGLFGELQDQVKLDDTTIYNKVLDNIEWVSLYQSAEGSLGCADDKLVDLDLLVIDIQDVGSRYYTYITSTWLLLKKITELELDINVVVSDKMNPAGRTVEGTRMTAEFSSFIGLEGLPHRHGLTMGELCRYFKAQLKGKWQLVIEPVKKKNVVFISPSPNIPAVSTCQVYSGQCLWEGTNISEGRGTTRPFETVGAPFLDWVFGEKWNHPRHPAFNRHCQVRPLIFIPVFHKFAGTACRGIQLMIEDRKDYHSLSHSLQLIRYFREKTRAFEWREGKYEAFNDKKAIELLVGDQLLLDYTANKADWKQVTLKLDKEEKEWIREASPFLLYKPGLQKLKIK